MRVIFMGTPEFATPALRSLVEADYEVAAVVTQPDKPAGRGRAVVAPPVKEHAVAHGLPVMQPESLKRSEVELKLRTLRPDAIVVAAFGQLLPKSVLAIPPLGCVNIHPSLLPKHRGSSPVAGAILAGETVTGVTIMLMDEGWDTGPVLAQRSVPIAPDDTTGSLESRLARIGAELLMETLPRWAKGEVRPQAQDNDRATYTRATTKEDGRIDWHLPAGELSLRCRAYSPWPGCFTHLDGRLLKILRSRPLPKWKGKGVTGQVVEIEMPEGNRPPKAIGVVTGQGALLLEEVQQQGGKPLPVEEFARGQRRFVGSVLN